MIKLIKVTESDIDTRIDRWLKRNLASLNQSYLEKNLRKGLIKVNDKKVKSNYKVKNNDVIKIYNFTKENYSKKIIKNNKKIIPTALLRKFNESIIFQNEDFIILNKWNNIATQGGTRISISINDIIKTVSEENNLVHRLDIDTSGLLIISKNLKTTKSFGKLFKEKKIKKLYFAICNGYPKIEESTLKFKLTKTNDEKKSYNSITKYKVLYKKGKISIILFNPLTGKKHQLRIISKNLGCPIVGDKKYNIYSKNINEKLKLNSYFLSFFLYSKEYIFYSKFPKDFDDYLKKNMISIDIGNLLYTSKNF